MVEQPLNTPPSKNVAIFFDYENIVYSLKNRFEQKANFEALVEKCLEFGQVVEARAFADWSMPYMSPALLYALQSSGFDLIFVPTGSTQSNSPRKNVADLYMAIHVMQVLYTRPEINTYVLLTGDRDFMPLVNVLQREGKHVVAIGVDGSSSYYLTQAVDDFFYYSEVEAIYDQTAKRPKGRPVNIYDALVQAIQVLLEKGKQPRLTNLKQVMIELLGGFDEKEYTDSQGRHFQKFKDFVHDAQRRGVVKLENKGRYIEVHLTSGKRGASPSPTPQGSSASSSKGSLGLQGAFKLLVLAVQQAHDEQKSSRASSIKARIRKLNPAFNERETANGQGQTFDRFSDFARAAADEGLVSLKGSGVKLEVLPVNPNVIENDDVDDDIAVSEIPGARQGILDALTAFNNYPTSFHSLANHCHRVVSAQSIGLSEHGVRELLTEAVNLDLVHKSKRPDGKTQYELQADQALIAQYLAGEKEAAASETDVKEAQPVAKQQAAKPAATEAVVEEADSSAYDTLVKVVAELLEGKQDSYLTRVKSGMNEALGQFDEKEHKDASGKNFVKFKDFVLEAQRLGHVRLETEGTINRVLLPETEGSVNGKGGDKAPAEAQSNGSGADSAETAPEFLQYREANDSEQRALVVSALKAHEGYPAPFMGLLAQCRTVRDERQIFLPNMPLRELLSESTKVGVLNVASEKGVRPTLYAFTEDENAIASYLSGEPPVAEAAEAEATEQTESKPTAQKPKSKKPAKKAEKPAEPSIEPLKARQLLVESLDTFDRYPAEFKSIEMHFITHSNAQKSELPKKLRKDVLSDATRGGVIKMVSPYGVKPKKYMYTNEKELVKAFLTPPKPEVVEETKPAAQPELIPAEPVAEAKDVPVKDIYADLAQAVSVLATAGKSTIFRSVKKQLREQLGHFEERDYVGQNGKPFRRFKDFAEEGARRGVVVIEKSGKSDMLVLPTVSEPGAQPETAAQPEPKAEPKAKAKKGKAKKDSAKKDDAPKAAKPKKKAGKQDDALAAAFELLITAVNDAQAAGTSQRLSSIRSRMVKANPEFDYAKLKGADGKAFEKLSDFVRAAEAAGHVKLSGKGIALQIHTA